VYFLAVILALSRLPVFQQLAKHLVFFIQRGHAAIKKLDFLALTLDHSVAPNQFAIHCATFHVTPTKIPVTIANSTVPAIPTTTVATLSFESVFIRVADYAHGVGGPLGGVARSRFN
jgi:hypothetical protein